MSRLSMKYVIYLLLAFQLWCIEAKVNGALTSGTDADVVLELSLSDGTTCLTNSLNSWKDDFEVKIPVVL